MSLKNPRNLVIIGAVVAALLVGTVLLGGYANIISAESDAGSQAEACLATNSKTCPITKACLAENEKVSCAQKAGAGFDAETCPLGRTEPCCAEEIKSLCGKSCPLDCTMPCCAGEAVSGCCEKSQTSETSKTCCDGQTETAAQ
jgi:hypothetical protein